MPILTMPTSPGFTSGRMSMISNSREFTSTFNGGVQTEEIAGAKWSVSYSLPIMTREQAAAWQVFGLKCRGRSGRFYAFDPDYAILGPRGNPAGAPRVKGAAQDGVSLGTDGWLPNTRIFETADQFAFDTPAGRELKMIDRPIDSDANGNADLFFEPPIRTSPDDDAVIMVDKPSCIMKLDDDVFGWDTDILMKYQISVSATEVFR